MTQAAPVPLYVCFAFFLLSFVLIFLLQASGLDPDMRTGDPSTSITSDHKSGPISVQQDSTLEGRMTFSDFRVHCTSCRFPAIADHSTFQQSHSGFLLRWWSENLLASADRVSSMPVTLWFLASFYFVSILANACIMRSKPTGIWHWHHCMCSVFFFGCELNILNA